MFLAKQPPTTPAVDRRVVIPKGDLGAGGDGSSTYRVGACISIRGALPMGPCDLFFRVPLDLRGWVRGTDAGGAGYVRLGRGGSIVGFEDIEALEFLIQHSKGLEAFGLLHLCLEPVLDLILFFFDEVLVVIVEMSTDRSEPGHI
jgi:hypothetical protein